MTLSLDTILMYMKEYHPEYDAKSLTEREIEGMNFYHTDISLNENTIYICDEKKLEFIGESNENFVFFGVNNYTSKKFALKKNIVLFSKAKSLYEIFENYTQIVNEMSNWERQMHQALLYNCTFKELLQIASKQIYFPIGFFDAGFNVVASSTHHSVNVHDFDLASHLGYTPPEFMLKIKQRNLLSKVQNISKAIIQHAVSDDNDYNIYRCHKVDGKIAGYSTIFCGSEKPANGYIDICELYFQAVDLYLKITKEIDQSQTYMYEYFLSMLIQSKNNSGKQLSERLKYIGLPAEGIFTLVKFVFWKEGNYNSYLCSLLQKYFPDKYFFIHQEGIYYLNIIEDTKNIYHHKDVLKQVIGKIEMQLGKTYPMASYFSNPFHDLTDLYYAGIQCNELQSLKTPVKEDQLVFFEDNLFAHYIYNLDKNYERRFITLPLYSQIFEYDTNHNTEFIKTLQTYLECNRNLIHTANCLGLHRNSVEKRIKKIESIFHISLENMETMIQLCYSFKLNEYYEN